MLEERAARGRLGAFEQDACCTALADERGNARRHHHARRGDLGEHAAGAEGGRGRAGDAEDALVDVVDAADQLGGGVGHGIGRVQPVDIGEDHIEVCGDKRRDDGAEHVVVAEGELRDRHRVVLVDDGDDAELEQALEGVAGVEVALAVDHVAPREQDLRAGKPVRGKGALVGLDEPRLAGGGARLERGDIGGTGLEAEDLASRRGSARGDRDDVDPALAERGDLGAEAVDVAVVEPAVGIDERGRADLHDDEPGRLHHASSPSSSKTSSSSRTPSKLKA